MSATKSIAVKHQEDIMLWADGTWCFRYELATMSHMSDDYETIICDTQRWVDIVGEG